GQPAACGALGAECGDVLDGCNGVLSCGTCPEGQLCGGNGPNKCGPSPCRPSSCTQIGIQCGKASDGCSLVIDCGGCLSPETCGGGGVMNQCGCTAITCDGAGANCGQLSDEIGRAHV